MRRLIGLVVITIVLAIVAAAIFVVRPSLDDKESTVDERWEPVAAALTTRYDALNVLALRVGDAGDDPRAVVDETLDAIEAWWAAIEEGTEEQVELANRLEGLAARIEATVLDSSRLASDEAVQEDLDRLTLTTVPEPMVNDYNDAVRAYDDARTSITGQPVAGIFGFDARTEFAPV